MLSYLVKPSRPDIAKSVKELYKAMDNTSIASFLEMH